MLDSLIKWIIENGGLYILLFVVFAETGLFVGFFLPGDSLLFAAGIYIKNFCHQIGDGHEAAWKVVLIIVLVIAASILRKHSRVLVWPQNRAADLRTERVVAVPQKTPFARKRFLRAQW
jgi:membrane-associated protein